jgi:hypothetical protein
MSGGGDAARTTTADPYAETNYVKVARVERRADWVGHRGRRVSVYTDGASESRPTCSLCGRQRDPESCGRRRTTSTPSRLQREKLTQRPPPFSRQTPLETPVSHSFPHAARTNRRGGNRTEKAAAKATPTPLWAAGLYAPRQPVQPKNAAEIRKFHEVKIGKETDGAASIPAGRT